MSTKNNKKEIKERTFIYRTYQVVWYVLGLFEFLLLFRFIFRMSAASRASAFVRMIYAITEPLIAPFRGIYPVINVKGAVFEWITLVAMLVWALLAYGIVYLFQVIKPVNESEIKESVDNI